MTVVHDDDLGRISKLEEEKQQSPFSQTSPTLPVHDQPSPSPPCPIRQRDIAQLRPVSIPNILSDIAGPDPQRRIADFDRHYMPVGQPATETSTRVHEQGLWTKCIIICVHIILTNLVTNDIIRIFAFNDR
jgi:hypothetical protein